MRFCYYLVWWALMMDAVGTVIYARDNDGPGVIFNTIGAIVLCALLDMLHKYYVIRNGINDDSDVEEATLVSSEPEAGVNEPVRVQPIKYVD